MKPWLPVLLFGLLCASSAAEARPVEHLNACETLVTGQGEAERARGLGVCLTEVLVRVSGRPGLADDPRLQTLIPGAARAVLDLEYEDRMKALPVGDEQGTRDRPFFLRPTFRDDAIGNMLAGFGLKPWGADRPVLAVVVTSHRDGRDWVVARGVTGVTAGAQVEALDAAGNRFGVPLILPETAGLAPGEAPADLAARLGGEALLVGDLSWDETAPGWRVTWSMPGQAAKPWSRGGVSFDDAFRAGVGGAASILSGGPQPE
ncbi:DUF2066 domain-containing protein [Zavarzinia aquatilis]|uniref:DUF2066 domain-containing protein n=1 Tax=Zavarzinia aquatilis TaxID=2211142 RepID=A0A317EED0_9PROT|nr:DUF2066 domain-containing protein [Zavarzinia aquatilis]PWR24470.1 DUF2066 domain-containing protein [Zavarzinia aquatilis]